MEISACEADLPARIPETGIPYLAVSWAEVGTEPFSDTRRVSLDLSGLSCGIFAVRVDEAQLSRLNSEWLDIGKSSLLMLEIDNA